MNTSDISSKSATSRPDNCTQNEPVSSANANKDAPDDAEEGIGSLRISDPSAQFVPLDDPPPYRPPSPAGRPLDTRALSDAAPDEHLQRDSNTFTPSPGVPRPATDTFPVSSVQQEPQSAAQKAYGEARHYLGGLINHPTESNKHFTILRHSHGVVFYRGSTTSVTFSIFSDAPLPPDRTLWLQSRGWTGKTGMRTKALLRLHNDWLNVTPSVALQAGQVDPANERAWQRDITRFRRKGPAKVRDAHQLRETIMARVPVEAGDGYFQMVLCQGMKKKVLCNSPVFRVLSTSANPSSIRGASLSTLPLELGAMMLGSYARSVVEAVASPVTSAVENSIQPYQPSAAKTTAAKTAFSISNVEDRVGNILGPQDERNPQMSRRQEGPERLDQGPIAPFPMDFKGRGNFLPQGQQDELQESSIVNITGVPDAIQEQLRGYYMCWARFYKTTEKEKANEAKDASENPWYQSILSIRNIDHASVTRVNMSHITKKTISLRFLEEIQFPAQFKLQVRVMRFIRPEIQLPVGRSETELLEAREAVAEASLLADSYDASYTQTVLDHPAWAPEVSKLTEAQKENAGLLDRTKSGLHMARTHIQKVPLHLIGIRSPASAKMEQQIAVNGFYVVR